MRKEEKGNRSNGNGTGDVGDCLHPRFKWISKIPTANLAQELLSGLISIMRCEWVFEMAVHGINCTEHDHHLFLTIKLEDWLHYFQFSFSSILLFLVTKSCPTFCDPMDCSPSDCSVHGISQQKYQSGLPCPSPGDVPNLWIKPVSPALQTDSLPMSHQAAPFPSLHFENIELTWIYRW